MNPALFIARRLYSARRTPESPDGSTGDNRPHTSFNSVATAGVAVGLAVMVISVCVILGFKHAVRDKVTGFGCHITVADFFTLHGETATPIILDDSLRQALADVPGVRHVQRYALKQGMLKTDSDFLGVMFKGVAEEYDTAFLSKCITEGRLPRRSNVGGTTPAANEILISQTMADKLLLHAGDRVFAYFLADDNLRTRRFTVAGIYKTDMSMFDDNIVIADLATVVRLNGWTADQATGAELLVDDLDRVDDTEQAIIHMPRRDREGNAFTSATVYDTYPGLFSWLDLLDLNVWIILALMTCVAAVTMISGLLIIILERTNMIGLMKALGAPDGLLRRIFLWVAVFIIGRGMIIGDVIALALVALQQLTGLVQLDAETYYVDTVPVEINVPLILLINAAALAVNVFILIAPSYIIAQIQPSRSMRYE